MSKQSVKTAVITLLQGATFPLPPFPSTATGSFSLVSDGERKDYANQTPVAAVVSGKTAAERQAMPSKWNHLSQIHVLIYVAYTDQFTAEQTRDSICDAVLAIFEAKRSLGGAQDVRESLPFEWDPGYQEIGGTEYLMATLTLRVWEQFDQPITP